MASALALAATGCGGTTFKKDEPQTAVRDFLSEALVTENGQRACDYMTQEAQNALAERGTPGEKCREAMEKAQLVTDGEAIGETGEVKDLDYSVQKDGDKDATVTVKTKGGPQLNLTLRQDEGLGNLYHPINPWRITGGAEPLVQGR
ncbi:hypothetical protein [Patulibacter sp. SYSU D01012]|uniref:hypothetical protein n=1 Tax=Patulibacter sp. SYSU D01012 TaxID=2817381 RepID=UPI001B306CD5|nr:hypothetical protein [Patulibacter sp. SYSU D01012]